MKTLDKVDKVLASHLTYYDISEKVRGMPVRVVRVDAPGRMGIAISFQNGGWFFYHGVRTSGQPWQGSLCGKYDYCVHDYVYAAHKLGKLTKSEVECFNAWYKKTADQRLKRKDLEDLKMFARNLGYGLVKKAKKRAS